MTTDKGREYQPSGNGGTHSLPAMPHRLQTPQRLVNPNWPMGSGNRSNLRLLVPPINLYQLVLSTGTELGNKSDFKLLRFGSEI